MLNIFNSAIEILKREQKNYLHIHFAGFNLTLALLLAIYIYSRFEFINSQIPFYYTTLWGTTQLAPKNYLFLIPAMMAGLVPFAFFYYLTAKKFFLMYAQNFTLLLVTFVNLLLTYSTVRIIFIASSPFEPLVGPVYTQLILPFLFALALTILITPAFIKFFKALNVVTNPEIHIHPGMVLKRPAARGGGLVFVLAVIVSAFIFVDSPRIFDGIYFAAALLALLGILDDYQNTNPGSWLKILESPFVRLSLMSLIVLIPAVMGIRIDSINNPFDGIIDFTRYSIPFQNTFIPIGSILFTLFWLVWVLNILSWSNGVDGQYGGIVGIACIVIALLALRFDPLQDIQINTAKLAIIASGAAFGLTRYNWYPSKILWGFGAVAAGLIISTTSIIIGAKIAAAMIIVLIPFLDAVVTFVRRIVQKRNPLRGDQGHLHHLLMRRGWGVRRIATFYWLTTALTGVVGLLSANRDLLLVVIMLGGTAAFFILALNVSAGLKYRLKKN